MKTLPFITDFIVISIMYFSLVSCINIIGNQKTLVDFGKRDRFFNGDIV